MDHDAPTLARLSRELDDLSLRMIEASATNPRIEEATPENQSSAENLVQYVALRRQDVRDLQLVLAELGVSSLGRAEAQVADHQRKKSACSAGSVPGTRTRALAARSVPCSDGSPNRAVDRTCVVRAIHRTVPPALTSA